MKASKKLAISHSVYPMDYNKNDPRSKEDLRRWRHYVATENAIKSIECNQFLTTAKLIIGGSYR